MNKNRHTTQDLARAGFLATLLLFVGGCGKGPTTPDPPRGPFPHSLQVIARTLHHGEAVTGTYTVTLLANGRTFIGDIGGIASLDTTANRDEMCDILINGAGCLPREFRQIAVSNNVLTTDLLKLTDFDLDYLLADLLKQKDNDGRALNTAWRPTFINGSSNPGGAAGARLDPGYLEGADYGPALGFKGILPALLDFQAWGKKFTGTPSEEPYITTFAFDLQGSYPESGAVPPDGDFRVFRADPPAGISVVNYPLVDVKVSASVMRIDPQNAAPLDAYRWTLGALVGVLAPIEDLERYRDCLPILMWRSRNKYSYGISATLESQTRIDAFNTYEETSGSAPPAPAQAAGAVARRGR